MRAKPNQYFILSAACGLLLYGAGVFLGQHHPRAIILRLFAVTLLATLTFLRSSVSSWTLFSLLMGAEIGTDAPDLAIHLHVFAEVFLRLVRMIIAPLIFGSLTVGIAGHSRLRVIGRIAWKTFLYFELVTTLALVVGAVAINLTRAGEGVSSALPVSTSAAPAGVTAPTAEAFLINVVPENIALAISQNQLLQVAVFSVFFGVALSRVNEPSRSSLLIILRSLTDTMFQMTRIVMYAAPIAAGAAIAYSVGQAGPRTLLPLAKLLLTYYGAILAFALLVLLPIALLARISIRRLVVAIAEPAAIGFATTTSEAALPLAMERMEEFGVPRSIVSFVIPAGYSFNMDGACIYLAVAAIFTAQASGMHLSLTSQASILFSLMLTSKGIAGVPRAVLAVLLGTAASFHLPTAPILMILGIDALMDMGRTALNVTGNCVAAAVIGRLEQSRVAESSS